MQIKQVSMCNANKCEYAIIESISNVAKRRPACAFFLFLELKWKSHKITSLKLSSI